MKLKIETLTNLAILVFLVVLAGMYIKGQFSSPSRPLQIKAGDQVNALPGYDWASHPRTLVLALRYGCHYCEESADFYQRLTKLEKDGQLKGVHIVAVFPDDKIVAQRALQLENLAVDYIPSISFQDLKVAGTPTVILVDDQKRVLNVWVGKLPGSGEQNVVESLERSPAVSELKFGNP